MSLKFYGFLTLAVVCLLPATVVSAAEPSSVFEAQVALSRAGFSPGVVDGNWGQNTRNALEAWQEARGRSVTGELDDETLKALTKELENGAETEYTLTEEDVSGPFVEKIPDSLRDQAELDHLGYTSVTEKVAEMFRTTPEHLRALNPDAEFEAGETLTVPNVPHEISKESVEGVTVVVSESRKALQAHDAEGNVIFHAPITPGSAKEPMPRGEFEVAAIAEEPTYTYDPTLFDDTPDDGPKVDIAAGPNNPVGTVWISITKDNYGLHGTPEPAQIGYDVSHGCVRLTNWDALRLAYMVGQGTPVKFED